MTQHGYVQVRLPDGYCYVHRLVCLAFHGAPPTPRHEVRHLNGNKMDNLPINLCWGTRAENFIDTVRHGSLKLDPESVTRIRYHLIWGAKQEDLARVFKVSYHTIYYISTGFTWQMPDAGYTQEFLDWIEQEKMIAAVLAGDGSEIQEPAIAS